MTQQPEQPAPAITYADAGVDTAAGDRAVALMKDAVASTMTPAVVGGVGGFAGLVDVSTLRDYRRPLLATSTDGVGTKVAIAQALDIHDTIGQDLVGMVVDDIVVVGARRPPRPGRPRSSRSDVGDAHRPPAATSPHSARHRTFDPSPQGVSHDPAARAA